MNPLATGRKLNVNKTPYVRTIYAICPGGMEPFKRFGYDEKG